MKKQIQIKIYPNRNSRPDFSVIRKLRDIIPALKSGRKTVIFVSPKLVIPCEMEKEISILDFNLPSEDEIRELFDELVSSLNPENVNLTEDDKILISSSASGLTMQKAENAFCRYKAVSFFCCIVYVYMLE